MATSMVNSSALTTLAFGSPALPRKARGAVRSQARSVRANKLNVVARKAAAPEPTSLDKAKDLFANPLVSKGMWSVAAGIALATDASYIDPQEWINNVGMSPDLVPVIQEKLSQVAIVHVLCLAGVAYFCKEKELDTSTTLKSLGKTAAVGPLAFAEVALLDAEQLTR
mmetsp:Transcript_35784/g.43198  ORF Transcript_35784/g.43198 Transcript_35784/m.43198 type:complete len:168 (-) Transcript_35784:161-664(-)|eukprot:CAMPEP_0197859606 /NCGR_PEP_ID=MMETSP1438-20131217/34307_1 /TAXON_ID=1461541 /ORGANISM="Pterosperma sp., Strain CCMP1384" /LENGTH=167 /DNA_ID=CAMNT_0043476157 /DNA_START=63 /DNA_END=566 /DNA_ORIENTATION=+